MNESKEPSRLWGQVKAPISLESMSARATSDLILFFLSVGRKQFWRPFWFYVEFKQQSEGVPHKK